MNISITSTSNSCKISNTVAPSFSRVSCEADRVTTPNPEQEEIKLVKDEDKLRAVSAMRQLTTPKGRTKPTRSTQGSELSAMQLHISRPRGARRRFERSKSESKLASSRTTPTRRQIPVRSKSDANARKIPTRRPPSRSNSASRLATAVGCTLLSLGEVNAFASTKVTQTAFTKTSNALPAAPSDPASSTSLKAFGIFKDASDFGSSLSEVGDSILSAATSILSPAEECSLDGGDLCKEMSMVAESLPAFLKQGNLAVRTGVLASQLLNLTADLLPGNHVAMDSLAYQVITIGITSHSLLKTLQPMIEAAMKANKDNHVSIRDRRTYKDLFAPAGVTWSQYNAMSASSMEWIAVEPGQTVPSGTNDDDCLYYLYQGDMEVHSMKDGNNEPLYHVERKKHYEVEDAAGTALIGEETIIKSLYGDNHGSIGDDVTVKAGKLGAKLLCIKASKLNSMMHQDDDLSRSMGLLVMQSMHAKLNKQAGRQS